MSHSCVKHRLTPLTFLLCILCKLRLPCENILRGYLYDGDLVFVILKGISILKFLKKVFGDLFQRSHFFSSSANLKTWLPIHRCTSPLHSHGPMPSKQQSHILTVYQTHVFAKLHKQIKHWLRLKKIIEALKRKGLNAMTALSKFLVLLALFLSASHANAFRSLSLVAGNQVLVNHLIQLQQPMSYPTNKPSCKPISEPIKWMDFDAEHPNNLLPQKTWVAYS